MSIERPPEIPEENELPLRVKSSKKIESPGIETEVYRAEIAGTDWDRAERVVLKEVKGGNLETVEETAEEAKQSKAFYNFLKSSPKFAEFVPETHHFVARMKEGEPPRSYRLQRHIEGRRLDEIADKELYADLSLDRELLRCINGLIDLFERQRSEGGELPDLYGKKTIPNLLFNPRHTTNLIIADQPNQRGQRIFFIDTSKQSQGKTSKAIDWYQKNVGGPAQLAHLKRWRWTLERKLAPKRKPVVPGEVIPAGDA